MSAPRPSKTGSRSKDRIAGRTKGWRGPSAEQRLHGAETQAVPPIHAAVLESSVYADMALRLEEGTLMRLVGFFAVSDEGKLIHSDLFPMDSFVGVNPASILPEKALAAIAEHGKRKSVVSEVVRMAKRFHSVAVVVEPRGMMTYGEELLHGN